MEGLRAPGGQGDCRGCFELAEARGPLVRSVARGLLTMNVMRWDGRGKARDRWEWVVVIMVRVQMQMQSNGCIVEILWDKISRVSPVSSDYALASRF
jgi:hypothetical protein